MNAIHLKHNRSRINSANFSVVFTIIKLQPLNWWRKIALSTGLEDRDDLKVEQRQAMRYLVKNYDKTIRAANDETGIEAPQFHN